MNPRYKEANIKRSIIKYFREGLPEKGVPANRLLFDGSLSQPNVRAGDGSFITEWISFIFDNDYDTDPIKTKGLRVLVCSRNDPNGINLAVLQDAVNELIEGDDSTPEEEKYRIPIYNFETDPNTLVGQMMVFQPFYAKSQERVQEDETKNRILYFELKWG